MNPRRSPAVAVRTASAIPRSSKWSATLALIGASLGCAQQETTPTDAAGGELSQGAPPSLPIEESPPASVAGATGAQAGAPSPAPDALPNAGAAPSGLPPPTTTNDSAGAMPTSPAPALPLGGAPDLPQAGAAEDSPGTAEAGGAAPGPDASAPPRPARTSDAAAGAGASETAPADACDIGVWDGTPPEVLSLSGNTFAHDPTMIEAGGVFYRFWTGDNIPVATSTDMRNWRNAPAAYRDGYPPWVSDWKNQNPGTTFNFPWAPDVSYFGGQFHLYSSFSAFFGRNISCITHLTTSDPAAGEWTDHGPVICTEGEEDYNAIDADVGLDVEGNPWLSFGSFWGGIQAFALDQNGDRVGDTLTTLAWAPEIEAPVLFQRCGYYYLFVTWGLCCPGEGRSVDDLTYRVAVGRADNILGPYLDRDGRAMADGGGTLVTQGDGVTYAAAGHSDVIVSGSTIYHFYHAYRQSDGGAELRIVELPFDDEGWPVPGGP